jgi:hypothetical protein
MIRKDLLQLLANHLRTVKAESFNLGLWKCGTTACAIGHAVDVPEIYAEGLRLIPTGIPEFGFFRPDLANKDVVGGWDAIETLFEIDSTQSAYLFLKDRHCERATPTDVANRIDQFIKENPDA